MLIETVRSAIKNWWVHLLLGILLIIMGAWVMTTPICISRSAFQCADVYMQVD